MGKREGGKDYQFTFLEMDLVLLLPLLGDKWTGMNFIVDLDGVEGFLRTNRWQYQQERIHLHFFLVYE